MGALGYALEYGTALCSDLRPGLAGSRHARLRRHPRLQSARPVLPHRRILQAVRQEFPVRSSRHQSGALRGEVRPARFLLSADAWLERWTFRTADVSIATNESYRRIAIERGGMPPERVFVVRSGPSLERMRIGRPTRN